MTLQAIKTQLEDGVYKTWPTKAAVVADLRKVRALYQGAKTGRFFVAGNYRLQHGEYEAPEFAPCRYKDGWGIKEFTFFYPGTCYPRVSGRRVMLVREFADGCPPDVRFLLEEDYKWGRY